MRSACRVTLNNKVILRDELIEGDEKVGKGGEEVSHHGGDAFRVHDLGITASRVMHNLRAENIAQHERISTIDHIIVPRPGDRGTLNLGRGGTAPSSPSRPCRPLRVSILEPVDQIEHVVEPAAEGESRSRKAHLVRRHGAGCIAPQRVPLVMAAPRKIHSDYECEQAIE